MHVPSRQTNGSPWYTITKDLSLSDPRIVFYTCYFWGSVVAAVSPSPNLPATPWGISSAPCGNNRTQNDNNMPWEVCSDGEQKVSNCVSDQRDSPPNKENSASHTRAASAEIRPIIKELARHLRDSRGGGQWQPAGALGAGLPTDTWHAGKILSGSARNQLREVEEFPKKPFEILVHYLSLNLVDYYFFNIFFITFPSYNS